MANNVLDKSAMSTIARIEAELPHLVAAMDKLATSQDKTDGKVDMALSEITTLAKDVAVTKADVESLKGRFDRTCRSLERSIEEIPNLCPHREEIANNVETAKILRTKAEDLDRRQIDTEKKVSSLETSRKIDAGITTSISALAGALTGWLSSLAN